MSKVVGDAEAGDKAGKDKATTLVTAVAIEIEINNVFSGKLHVGTMSQASINWIKAELRAAQALRWLGRFAETRHVCMRALNRFRGDPATVKNFRKELALCHEEEVNIFPGVVESKVMGVN